jgi:long-chain acyl-CoA synthetase
MTRTNLISLFGEFERYAHDVAVVQRRGYRRECWTYARLAGAAVTCALDLKGRGVRTGDRVILWGPNSAEWMAAFWGCLLRGAVAVPLDDGATAEFAARVARETSASLIIGERGKPSLGAVVPVLALEDLADSGRPPRVVSTQGVPGESRRPLYQSLADEPITRKHLAQILFTSGTTTEPRGVVLTHGNFLANLEPLERGIAPYRKYEKWFHPLRFVTLVPLSHVFGQFMTLFVPPLLGATVVFEPSANPTEIVRTIQRERATAFIAVPRMFDGLRAGILREMESHGEGQWFRGAFASADGQKFLRRAWKFRRIHRRFGWKFWAFISGGAALSADTEEFFRRVGYAVVQGYGMTETASLISLNHPFRSARGTIGKVLPGREFRLAEDGEILVRGENVTGGYWEAGGVRALQEGEWLRTGDVGELDADGNLRFRGRKKNVIVTPAGLNIYPGDLEGALRKQAGVRDCVVIPIERGGNAEACAVLLMDAGNESAAVAGVAIENANRSLAEYQRVRCWVVWPEADFPRTATGKPRHAAVAAGAREILGSAGVAADRTANRETNEVPDREKNGGTDDAISTATGWCPGKLGHSGAVPLQTILGDLENLLDQFASADSSIPQRLKPGGGQGPMSELKLRPPFSSGRIENELNLSSLDRVELMSALEQRYQVELSETAFAEAKTVGDVERLLRDPAGRRAQYVYPRWTLRAPVRWLRLAVYHTLVWPATEILGHPKIVGRENLRALRGPVIVVSNHITRRADIGLILAALPLRFRHRLATAMGGETLWRMRRPPGDWFFAKRLAYRLGYWLVTALFNIFPLPQFSGFRESFRYAGECVDRGYSVLVFPEGEVSDSETGAMAKFQGGIGLLAENLNVPIVPMRLDGVWKMKREHRRFAHFGEITVRIGAPIRFPAGTAPEEIAARLESTVRSL